MNGGFRVVWFLALVAVVFTAAYGLGRSVGPFDDPAPEPGRHITTEMHS